jgi:hypothetical protein
MAVLSIRRDWLSFPAPKGGQQARPHALAVQRRGAAVNAAPRAKLRRKTTPLGSAFGNPHNRLDPQALVSALTAAFMPPAQAVRVALFF